MSGFIASTSAELDCLSTVKHEILTFDFGLEERIL